MEKENRYIKMGDMIEREKKNLEKRWEISEFSEKKERLINKRC